MNVLFVLYSDLSSNSASHVDGVARQLCARDCDCAIAVPSFPTMGDRFQPYPYQVASFAQVLEAPRLFRNKRGPDLVHFWNPREVNRQFHVRLSESCTYRTVIHLEDNEDHIARCMLGAPAYRLAAAGLFTDEFPAGLSHPVCSKHFMERADGFSLLIASLADMTPRGSRRVVFWPAVDPYIFQPRPRNDSLREELGISPATCVLTYHGNLHAANLHEVRSLYLAVALLNRTGIPAKLVRMGNDCVDLSMEYRHWAAEFTIPLGYVTNRDRVADVLATADLFVQPGKSDPFNDYRFPSKLPEFFAMGKPVILPRTNVGLETRHLEDAYVLEDANGATISNAISHLWSDPGLRKKLARGAQAFGAKNFSWERSADSLCRFYQRILKQCSRENLRLVG